jgi:hypothetical protein
MTTEHIATNAPVLVPKIGAVGEVVTSSPLTQYASGIMDALRGIAENPGAMSLENIGLGVAAMASVAAGLRAIQEIRKDRGEEETKRAAEKSARIWAQADGSLIAYADLRGSGLERSLVSATSDINRYMSRSDAGAQAVDIALKMSKEDRMASAMAFEESLDNFARVIPRDAGIAQNHATLARLASTPLEAVATGERAALGALKRGDAVTARGREACFTLLQSSAARAVAMELGEWTQDMVKPKVATTAPQEAEPTPATPKRGRSGRSNRSFAR